MAEIRQPEYFPDDELDEVVKARMRLGTVGSRACEVFINDPDHEPQPERTPEYIEAEQHLNDAVEAFDELIHTRQEIENTIHNFNSK